MRDLFYPFREIWLGDTEFVSHPGDPPDPVCIVLKEFRTKRKIILWQNQLGPHPPFPTGPDTLFVAFFASAEIGFFLALGWSIPERILDLYTEYRNRFNCLPTIVEQKLYEKGEEKPGRNSLIAALIQFGLSTTGLHKKKEMRDLIKGGGPWSPDERQKILDYCESDVEGLDRLLSAMLR
jgi:DNA polymerase-1